MSMRIEEFQKRWGALTANQRARVRAKARWEHMSLTAVLREWPDGWEDAPIWEGSPAEPPACRRGAGTVEPAPAPAPARALPRGRRRG